MKHRKAGSYRSWLQPARPEDQQQLGGIRSSTEELERWDQQDLLYAQLRALGSSSPGSSSPGSSSLGSSSLGSSALGHRRQPIVSRELTLASGDGQTGGSATTLRPPGGGERSWLLGGAGLMFKSLKLTFNYFKIFSVWGQRVWMSHCRYVWADKMVNYHQSSSSSSQTLFLIKYSRWLGHAHLQEITWEVRKREIHLQRDQDPAAWGEKLSWSPDVQIFFWNLLEHRCWHLSHSSGCLNVNYLVLLQILINSTLQVHFSLYCCTCRTFRTSGSSITTLMWRHWPAEGANQLISWFTLESPVSQKVT